MKHTPKKDRMNRIDRMKSPLFPILSILLILSFSAPATLVTFPVAQMYGGAQYVRPFTLTAQYPVITDGVNLYAGTSKLVTPSGGTNPVVQLTPNNYLLTFSDARQPLRFPVPLSTNTLNVLNLITNGLLTLTNWNPFAVAGFTGTVTNLAVILTNSTSVLNTAIAVVTNCELSAANGRFLQFNSTNAIFNAAGGLVYSNVNGQTFLLFSPDAFDGGFWILATNLDYDANLAFFDTTVADTPATNADWEMLRPSFGSTALSVSYGATVITAGPHYNVITYANGVCQTNIFQ